MPDNYNTRLFARGYAARGGAATVPATSRTSTQSPETNCKPPCADCGQLECLCRPRFFAGQLLSEQDLNRLDAYIRAKNKLHTLQLNGWGVVNGLDVRCEPCGTGVVVGRGYAISPCGDDIIVCCDAPVDICALIQQCLPPDNTCKPYQGAMATGCDDVIEDWVLAIRYTETPARGVTALRLGASCGCGSSGGSCSCGTKSASSCGCGAKPASTGGCGCGAKPASATMPTANSTAKPRGASPECEPTVICETYAWDVFPAPKPPKEKVRTIGGPLIDRLMCCLKPLSEIMPTMPGKPTVADFNKEPQAWNLWCCQTKAALMAYFTTGSESDCTIVERLMKLSCPDPKSETFAEDMLYAYELLVILLLEAIFACLCGALLPPAPCGTSDDRVPLAVVRVRKKGCTVVEVCNWTPLRKTVLTFPTLEYWLGWIPLFGSIGDAIHQICCTNLFARYTPPTRESAATMHSARGSTSAETTYAQPREAAMLRANPTLSTESNARNQTFTTLVTEAFARAGKPLDPAAIVGGLFGFDAGSGQTLSQTEKDNAPHFLLLNEVLRPVATSLLANQAPVEMLRTFIAPGAAAAVAEKPAAHKSAPADATETEALKVRIGVLEEAIKHLQSTKGKG